MILRTVCDIEFHLELPTPFIIILRPQNSPSQKILSESFIITPNYPIESYIDSFGNHCDRVVAESGNFRIQSIANVSVNDYVDQNETAEFINVQNLPSEILDYLLPSRYCESEFFGQMASTITQDKAPGYEQVRAIESWLRENIEYIPGSSNSPVSAIDTNYRKHGVCRDLAHLGIAMCRSLSIPARIAVGYLHKLKPMDMHAWFQAYIGDKWFTFDATQKDKKLSYVQVGTGRDAADVAIYNQFGPLAYPIKQLVSVEDITNN